MTSLDSTAEHPGVRPAALTAANTGMTTFQRPRADGRTSAPMSVFTWRQRQLLDVGFPVALADTLARGGVDLHEILGLVDAGCPPELAASILSPVDTAERSGTRA